MNITGLVSAVALLVGATQVASAISSPPNILLVGTTSQSVGATSFGGSCYIGHGLSTFLRNASAPRALVSFPEIVDSKVWDLSGQAILSFSSATGGDLVFTNTSGYPAKVRAPSFSNYSQAYAEGRLIVKFTIAFPDCNLNFLGSYAS